MKHNGLTRQEVGCSRKTHGANTLTQIPPDPLWKKILEGFKDPMIMILLVALVGILFKVRDPYFSIL